MERIPNGRPVAVNLLDQNFAVTRPNQVWVIPTGEGWLYRAGHKDLFNGELLGHAQKRDGASQVICHQDRGHAGDRGEYLEIFYNRQRCQKRLGNLSPAAFQRRYYEQQRAA